MAKRVVTDAQQPAPNKNKSIVRRLSNIINLLKFKFVVLQYHHYVACLLLTSSSSALLASPGSIIVSYYYYCSTRPPGGVLLHKLVTSYDDNISRLLSENSYHYS